MEAKVPRGSRGELMIEPCWLIVLSNFHTWHKYIVIICHHELSPFMRWLFIKVCLSSHLQFYCAFLWFWISIWLTRYANVRKHDVQWCSVHLKMICLNGGGDWLGLHVFCKCFFSFQLDRCNSCNPLHVWTAPCRVLIQSKWFSCFLITWNNCGRLSTVCHVWVLCA